MTFELIGEHSFHQRMLDCPISRTVRVCINTKVEQFCFPLERVGDSSLAQFDVVRFLNPGEQLELGQLWGYCVIFTKSNADVIRHCSVFAS